MARRFIACDLEESHIRKGSWKISSVLGIFLSDKENQKDSLKNSLINWFGLQDVSIEDITGKIKLIDTYRETKVFSISAISSKKGNINMKVIIKPTTI